jgi:hypothetical protein
VGALVSATAIDAPGQFGFVQDSDSRIAGPVQGMPPVLSLGAMATSGVVMANAGVQTNAYTGQIKGSAVSMVGADVPAAGRGGSARFSGSMMGSITLGSAGMPGMATFSAVVEGAYNFGTSPSRFSNTAYIESNGVVGDQYRGVNRVDFDPFTGAGLFSFPLTWTLAVQPGQRIDMSFYVLAGLASVVDKTEVNMLNTFKLTAIDLPDGYTYTSDASDFLSQFSTAAVPEPSPAGLFALGLVALVWRRLPAVSPTPGHRHHNAVATAAVRDATEATTELLDLD